VVKKYQIKLPPDFGEDELSDKHISCIFNADVKGFIGKLELYNGSYIDKRFWQSQFWKKLKSEFNS